MKFNSVLTHSAIASVCDQLGTHPSEMAEEILLHAYWEADPGMSFVRWLTSGSAANDVEKSINKSRSKK